MQSRFRWNVSISIKMYIRLVFVIYFFGFSNAFAQSVVEDYSIPAGTISLDRDTVWNYKNLVLGNQLRVITNGHTLVINISENLLIDGEAVIQSFPDSLIDGFAEVSGQKSGRPRDGVTYDRGPDSQGQGPGIAGRDGGDGVDGQDGIDGDSGKNGGTISLVVGGQADGSLSVLNRGSDARDGSPGGDASNGGSGEQGGRAQSEKILRVYFCSAGAARGGDGGRAGIGAAGGTGGGAGNGGTTNINILGETTNFSLFTSVRKGAFGRGASGGSSGRPGAFGYGGRGASGCEDSIDTRKGRPGQAAPMARGVEGEDGSRGRDGSLLLNGIHSIDVN